MLHVFSVETLERLTPFIAFISFNWSSLGSFSLSFPRPLSSALILHDWNKKFSIKLHRKFTIFFCIFIPIEPFLLYFGSSGNSLAMMRVMSLSLMYREGWSVPKKCWSKLNFIFIGVIFFSLSLLFIDYWLWEWHWFLVKL